MLLLNRVLNLPARQLSPLAVLVSVVATELIVCGMALLLEGHIAYNYLLTGLVASLSVSLLAIKALRLNLFIKQQEDTVSRLQDFSVQLKAQADELFEKNRLLLIKEEERHKTESKLNALFENMSNGVAIYQPSADGLAFFFAGFNRAAERIEGLSRQQVLGKNVADVFPITQQSGLLAVFQRVYATGHSEYFPLSIYEQGRLKSWRDNHIYRLPSGEIVAIYEDITQRKQLEQERHQLNEELLHYFNQPLVGMLTANHNKQTLHVNQRFCDMVGYSKAELQTIDWGKLTHLDDIALNQQYMDSAIRGEIDSYQLEKRYIHKDGHSVYVHLSTSCVRDAQGQVDYFIGMMLDISERKRSEQRLQQSESRFRELFAHTPVAYQSLDRNGCFLDVNEPLCRLLGYTREALIGRAVSEFWSTRLRPDFKKRFARFIEKGQSHGELELLRANGELITVLLEGCVQYDMQGNFVCTHCILVNITERKRMEDALNQSNADLEQFAYGVSHDMRQPLRAITNHLQLLQRSIASELDSDNAENLSFALEGAQRMDAMIKSLLEYSRIGRLAEHKTWLLSRDALNEAIDFLSNALEDAHIHLSITGEWPCIFASHDELVRLFLNLLSNAIKYRETEQPPLVTINAVIIGTQWQVSVRDFGIGIEPEQIGRLFQFFGRLHPWQRFEGTGMGLALCKRIVEHHQGTIWVESIGANQGCCFYFSLPLTVELAK